MMIFKSTRLLKIIVSTAIFCVGTTSFAQDFSKLPNKKIVIYQLLPRYFGNKKNANIPYGTIEQNGSGKFNDITVKALNGIKELHVNYVWYTGVIAHASLTDYLKFGIQSNDADVVKGRAGSPYAIRDYYDVDPDLAVNVANRMQEFEALVKRTHDKGLKVLIDFVPNHVARNYQSKAKPAGVIDFGANDDNTVAFSKNNDFYYIPNQPLKVPINPNEVNSPLQSLMDGKFNENPAKATGNNVFSASPAATDWYETIKLNYGVAYNNGKETNHFSPIPPIWVKMRDILIYWTKKGVDGFRCDVAEMVPVEFWEWVIPQVKAVKPDLIFMAEAYNPKAYQTFLTKGKFDYLYDKVGLYDALKKLIKNEPTANVKDITAVWQQESATFGNHMVRFLENHDEERIASKPFAGNPKLALPAMVVSATLGAGPVMLYFGQELGENAGVSEGFTGDDIYNARTTIFEYWGVPSVQRWMNKGVFDGAKLNSTEKELRAYYQQLLKIATQNEAIVKGNITEVQKTGDMDHQMYAYIRHTANKRVLVIANFSRTRALTTLIKVPAAVMKGTLTTAKDLLTNKRVPIQKNQIAVNVPVNAAQIIEF